MMDEINTIFGTHFHIAPMDDVKGLPVYMTLKRTFTKVQDGDSVFVLISVSDQGRFGVVALDKQRILYEDMFGCPIAYWFTHVTKLQREALIGRRIPFVADGCQLYLPFLGMAVYKSIKKEVNMDKMSPIAQSLFLYLLYANRGCKVVKKQAAEFLGVTRTSLTRASEQLSAMGLILQEACGKQYYMWMDNAKHEIIKKALPHMINPVQKSFTTENIDMLHEMPLSGESALAMQTMLNPSNMKCVAIDKAVAKEYSFVEIDEKWEECNNLVKLESWKYDPKKFARNGMVDPVSLYMTFVDNMDERIEGALEELLEEYKW